MQIKKYLKKLLIVFLVLILFFYLLKKYLFFSQETDIPLPSDIEFFNGDIILRKEQNHISDIFSNINQSLYSHIGVLLVKEDGAHVIHIEMDDAEDDLKIVELKYFVRFASKYAIYRPKKPVHEKAFLNYIENLQKNKPIFDREFNGKTDDNKIYCTELAYDIYNTTTQHAIDMEKMRYLHYEFIPLRLFYDIKYFNLIYSIEREND